MRNELAVRALDRSFLHDEFVCEATNTNLTRPVRVVVSVDMNFAPAAVAIVDKGVRLVAGEVSDVRCRTSGSRPPAHITWFLDDMRIEGATDSVSYDAMRSHGLSFNMQCVPII